MKGRNDPCFCKSGKKYKKCHCPLKEHQWRVVDDRLKQAEAVAATLPDWRTQ